MSENEQVRLLNQISILEGLIEKRQATARASGLSSSHRGSSAFRLSRNVLQRSQNVSQLPQNVPHVSYRASHRGNVGQHAMSAIRVPVRRVVSKHRVLRRDVASNIGYSSRGGSRYKLSRVNNGGSTARESAIASSTELANRDDVSQSLASKCPRVSTMDTSSVAKFAQCASVLSSTRVKVNSPSTVGGCAAEDAIAAPVVSSLKQRVNKSLTAANCSKTIADRRRIDRRPVTLEANKSRRISGNIRVVGSSVNASVNLSVASENGLNQRRSFVSLKNSRVLVRTSCVTRCAKPSVSRSPVNLSLARASRRITPQRSVFSRGRSRAPNQSSITGRRRRSSGRLVIIQGRTFRTTSKTLQRTSLSPNKGGNLRMGGKKLINISSQSGRLGGAPVFRQSNVATIARRVKSRALRITRSLNRQPCLHYCRRGQCPRYRPVNAGVNDLASAIKPPLSHPCRYRHDPRLRPPCTSQLMTGVCRRRGEAEEGGNRCPFNHEPHRLKLPLCLHFLHGECSRIATGCRLLHVKLDAGAPLCRRFLAGYCPLAEQCENKHLYFCDEFWLSGTCSRRSLPSGCPLVHRQRRRYRQQQGSSPPLRQNSSHSPPPRQDAQGSSELCCSLSPPRSINASSMAAITDNNQCGYRRYYQTTPHRNIEGATRVDENTNSCTDESFIRLPSCTTDDDEEDENNDDDSSGEETTSRFERGGIGAMNSFVALASSIDDSGDEENGE